MPGKDRDNEELTRPVTLVEEWDSLPDTSTGWQPGLKVGPFVLKRELGSGGMGMVWLAEQLVPLRREVALKVMLPERRSRLAEAHFEVERQAMAQLSHRAIAQIHDAGELPDGGLFFAMEFVPGQPLDRFLADHYLELTGLAEVMAEICAGIQHAHQHGLIHRDIKPANILVSRIDGQPQPKIIDFGIAIGEEDGRESAQGRYRRAGTLAYMAPEQRDGDGGTIDVRTDVYALGAVLAHCLLIHAGIDPDGSQRFTSATARDALDGSLRSGRTGDHDLAAVPTSQLKSVPAELRAISVRAMAAEREQRYPSASAMAEDLQRWLKAEPVQAMDNSRAYRLRCFLRRNALASAATALIGIALLAGTVLALYGLTEAREGRSQAENALTLAEQRRDEAEELIEFMLGDFASQLRPIGRLDLLDGIAEEALRYLTARDAGEDAKSALHRARALRTLGEVQNRRQQFDAATETLARAAELLAPWQDDERADLAEMHFEAGQIAFWRGAISYRQRDWETTETHWRQYMHHAEVFAELTDDRRRAREELAYAYNNLGTLAEARNQLEEAHHYFHQTVDMKRELADQESVESLIDLANALSWSARVESALGLAMEAWQNNNEALRLVTALRDSAPEHARRRRLEINFRFILARDARYLGLDEHAAEHLRRALRLAEDDVAIEPGQPRRQANLARITFMLATLPGTSSEESATLIARGERALNTAMDLGLDSQRAIEVPAQRVRARLHLDDYQPSEHDLAVLEEVFETLQLRENFDAHVFNLMDIASALIRALEERGAAIPAQWSEILHTQLDAVPREQRNSLRYQVIRYRLGRLSKSGSPNLVELEGQLQHLRDSVMSHVE